MFGWRDEFDYFTCAACGCVQITEVPDDLGRFYPPGYYSFTVPAEGGLRRFLKQRRARHVLEGRSALGRAAAWWFGVPEIFSWIAISGVQFDDPVLDVGSGGGEILREMENAGFRRLVGIDPYLSEERNAGPGPRLLRRTIEEMDGEFSLVMMHHSFEHMPDAVDAFRNAARLLKPGGMLLVRIPVADSNAFRRYGADWVQLDAPRHLFLHTRRSVEILAAASGLALERVVHDSGAFQFWGSEQYRRGIPLRSRSSYLESPRRSVFSRAEIRQFERQAAELNARGEGDQAAFYLRKPRDGESGSAAPA